MRIIPGLRSSFYRFVNLIWPEFCVLCKEKNFSDLPTGICESCFQKLSRTAEGFCARCGSSLYLLSPGKVDCPCCSRQKIFFDQANHVFNFDPVAQTCVHQLKYRRKPALAGLMVKKMLPFLKTVTDKKGLDVICAVPLHRTRYQERGFNQAHLLAKEISKKLDIDVDSRLLTRRKNTLSQSTLNKQERQKNINDAFECRTAEAVKNKNILLVDDVFTTGATINECAKTLKISGAKRVQILTFAR